MMIVLILTSPTFNPVELWGCINTLKRHKISFELCSTRTMIHEEKKPKEKVKIHGRVHEYLVRVDEFDALIIISGGGPEISQFFWHDVITQQLVWEFWTRGKLLAGICTGVPTFRMATENVKFTCWPAYEIVYLMESNGGIHTKLSVVWDKNKYGGWNVTAEHEAATEIWTKTIIELLKGEEPTLKQRFAFDVVKLKEATRRRKVREKIKRRNEDAI